MTCTKFAFIILKQQFSFGLTFEEGRDIPRVTTTTTKEAQ